MGKNDLDKYYYGELCAYSVRGWREFNGNDKTVLLWYSFIWLMLDDDPANVAADFIPMQRRATA